jgi:hypothetical protein
MVTGSAILTPAENARWRDVLPHFDVHVGEGGSLIFTCARCRLTFGYARRSRMTAPVLHLKAHLARHGVHFPETAPAVRKSAGRSQRRSADARPRQERFDMALTGELPSQ